MLDARLRPGNVGSAEGALNVILDGERGHATDKVDGSRSRHRDVPRWVLLNHPPNGAIQLWPKLGDAS